MSTFTDRVGLTREQLRASVDEATRLQLKTRTAEQDAELRRLGEEFRRESATINRRRRG